MSPRQLASQGMRAFLSAIGRETIGMHEAAYLLAAFALGSQLLALFRDRLFAGAFGATHTLDVYYAAFRVPDLLFATLASLLSLYALLPVLSRLELGGEGRGTAFLDKALLYFFAVLGCSAAVLFVFTPQILALTAPGVLSPELILLTRILLLQPILLGASNILASLTQLRHRFLLYSVSPLLYNIGIIGGIVVLYPVVGIAGLAWGVVLGAALHLLVQVPFFFTQPRGTLERGEPLRHMREVLRLSVPRTLALAAGQFSLLVLTAIASYLAPGSIAVFTFAFNLQAVPLAIIGVSYSVAAFPTLSRLHAGGLHGEFVLHILNALRHVLFWTVPATVLIIVLRAQLVRVILGAGAFDWEATRLVAAALALFIISLSAQSVSLLLARAYYAAGETSKPLLFGLVGFVVSVGSALALSSLFHSSLFARDFIEALFRVSDVSSGTTVLMLALGYCLGALAQAGGLLVRFSYDFGLPLRPLVRMVNIGFSSGVIGGAAAYGVMTVVGNLVDINTALGVLLQGAAGGIAGLLATVIVLLLLKSNEVGEVWGAFARRFKDTPPVVVLEPTDVSS